MKLFNGKLNKSLVLVLAGCLAVSSVGCGTAGSKDANKSDKGMQAGKSVDQAMAADSTLIEKSGDGSAKIVQPGAGGSQKIKPADHLMPQLAEYKFPYAGLKLSFPEKINKLIEQKKVALMPREKADKNGDLEYAFLTLSNMTAEQKDAEIELSGDSYDKWADGLERIGSIGFAAASMKEADVKAVAKGDKIKEIGKTEDGKYKYYLVLNSKAPADVTGEFEKTTIGIEKMMPMPQKFGSAFVDPADLQAGDKNAISQLNVKTLDGEKFTAAEFGKYDLTLVNVFATWCTACVGELPELEKLYQDMKGKGINVIGLVTDTVQGVANDGKVTVDEKALALAKKIREKAKVSFPLLQPDAALFAGYVKGVTSYPETLLVDRNGNVVGDPISGAHSYGDWKKYIEAALAKVKGKK